MRRRFLLAVSFPPDVFRQVTTGRGIAEPLTNLTRDNCRPDDVVTCMSCGRAPCPGTGPTSDTESLDTEPSLNQPHIFTRRFLSAPEGLKHPSGTAPHVSEKITTGWQFTHAERDPLRGEWVRPAGNQGRHIGGDKPGMRGGAPKRPRHRQTPCPVGITSGA